MLLESGGICGILNSEFGCVILQGPRGILLEYFFPPRLPLLSGEESGNPLQCSCLGNPIDWGAILGVANSGTPLSNWACITVRQVKLDMVIKQSCCAGQKVMAPHSSTLAWKIPWTEEPGRLQSMGSWRVGHNWATSLSLFTFMHWRRKWHPTPVFLPGESQGRWSLVGCHLWGHTESDTTEVT